MDNQIEFLELLAEFKELTVESLHVKGDYDTLFVCQRIDDVKKEMLKYLK